VAAGLEQLRGALLALELGLTEGDQPRQRVAAARSQGVQQGLSSRSSGGRQSRLLIGE